MANDSNSLSQITGDDVEIYLSNSKDAFGVVSFIGDGENLDGGNTGDDTDPDEGLLFSFSELVSLSDIFFKSFGSSDDYNLMVDGIDIFSDKDDSYDFGSIIGQEFLVWADGSSDAFYVSGLEVSAVPEPSIVALFGLGLLGMGFTRRKSS